MSETKEFEPFHFVVERTTVTTVNFIVDDRWPKKHRSSPEVAREHLIEAIHHLGFDGLAMPGAKNVYTIKIDGEEI